MNKLCIHNLSLVITENCNIDCAHCMRGEKTKNVMSEDVIDATFDQLFWVGNLCICGGEPTLAIPTLKYIIEKIVESQIMVESISITINGSIYSEEMLNLFDYFVKHSKRRGLKRNKIYLMISYDEYHRIEYEKLNILDEVISNIKKYMKSKYFYILRFIEYDIYNEGNAKNLNVDKVDFIPHLPIISYVGKKDLEDRENGAINIGPLVTIATDGTITEDNTSFINQRDKYNYGNVLNGRIDEILINNGSKVVKPKLFNDENEKLLLKFVQNEK